MVTKSDEEGVDVDVIVNIIGSSSTVQGIDSSSGAGAEAEIELGDIEVESESDSKSKAKAEGGGEFSPGPNGPPGQGDKVKSEGVLTKAKNLLINGKKDPKKEKKEKAKD